MKTKSIIFAGMFIAGQLSAAPFPVFWTGFEYAGGAPTVGNMISNLNGADDQVGTWTGLVPVGNGGTTAPEFISFPTVAGSTFMLADRGISDSIFTANFSQSIDIANASVSFDLGIRRTGGNHNKDITIVGFDSVGDQAFNILVSTKSTTPDEERIGVTVGGTPDFDLDTVVGADADNDLPNSGAVFGANDMASISLSLSSSGYVIDFARAALAYTTTTIPYNGTPIDLTRIDIVAQGGASNGVRSGFFLDNLLVATVPEPSTALPLMLLALVAVRRWTRK